MDTAAAVEASANKFADCISIDGIGAPEDELFAFSGDSGAAMEGRGVSVEIGDECGSGSGVKGWKPSSKAKHALGRIEVFAACLVILSSLSVSASDEDEDSEDSEMLEDEARLSLVFPRRLSSELDVAATISNVASLSKSLRGRIGAIE